MNKPPLYAPVAVLIAVAMAVSSANASQEPSSTAAGHGNTSTTSPAAAKKLYQRDCAMCHGENGNGQTDLARDMQLQLSDLSKPEALADKQDKELFELVRNGKDKMPPEAVDRAKDDDVRSLIQYVRSLSKPETAASTADN